MSSEAPADRAASVSAVPASIPNAVADQLGTLLSKMDERWMSDNERACAIVEAWERLRNG